LKVNLYQSYCVRLVEENIQVANARYGNLSSPIHFIVEKKTMCAGLRTFMYVWYITSPEKDMYKQFSLLILLDRNRYVIKERFLWAQRKKGEQNRKRGREGEIECADNVRSLTKKKRREL
jgi:hypothetical protein